MQVTPLIFSSLNLPFPLLCFLYFLNNCQKALRLPSPPLLECSKNFFNFLTIDAAPASKGSLCSLQFKSIKISNWCMFLHEDSRTSFKQTNKTYIETSIVLISSFKLPSWKYPVEWVLVWVTIMLFS